MLEINITSKLIYKLVDKSALTNLESRSILKGLKYSSLLLFHANSVSVQKYQKHFIQKLVCS